MYLLVYRINPNKFQNPIRKMEAFLARDPELKQSAQRAFVSYVKSISLMKDKTVFDVQALDTDAFAKSLGLAIPPRIRFLQRMKAKTAQKPQTLQNMANKKYFDTESDPEDENNLEQINNNINTSSITTDDSDSEEDKPVKKSIGDTNLFHVSDDSDSDDGILKVKRKDHDIELPSQEELEILDLHKNQKKKVVSKVALAKKILRKNIAPNKKTIFDEEGESVKVGTKEKRSELAQQYENENEGGIDIEKAKLVLREEDKFDKQLFKEKVKLKHKKEKLKLKEKRKAEKEEKDDFGTDSEGEAPDLSWLPDPDKIYGKANSADDDSNSAEFKNRITGDEEESNNVEEPSK